MRDTLTFRISKPVLALAASSALFLGACSEDSSSEANDTSGSTPADATGVTSSSAAPAASSETVVSVMETVTEVAEEAPEPEPVAEEPTQAPVLGYMPALSAPVGYGEVQPSELTENGVCGNYIANITWDSWGDEAATGTATQCVPAAQEDERPMHPEPIIASNLGDCGGVYAYRSLEFGGQVRDICIL